MLDDFHVEDDVELLTGVVYNPLADRWQRSKDMDVNYMVLAERNGSSPA